MQGKDAPTRPSLAFSPFPLASKSRQPWSLHSRRLSQSLVHHGRSAAPAWGTLFFLCRDLRSRSLHFSAKSAAWSWPLPPWRKRHPSPSRHLIDASSQALRCRAHGFAVKRGQRSETQRKRAPAIWQEPLKMGKEKAGTYLFSQVVSNQVSSALRSLTSVFGMGTGGTSA